MSTYPQWLLKTQERIFIGFVADIHKLDISHQFNDSLTWVKFSGRHHRGKTNWLFPCLISSQKVFGYNKIFSNKQIYTFDLFCLCIRCPSYTRKTTTISIVQQSNVCSTSLIIQTLTDWIIVNFGIRNPQIIQVYSVV